MDISLIFKLFGIGLTVSILNYILTKAGRDDIGLLISIVGLIVCLFLVVDITGELLNTIRQVFLIT